MITNTHAAKFLDDADAAMVSNKPILADRYLVLAASMPISDAVLLSRLVDFAKHRGHDEAIQNALTRSPLTKSDGALQLLLAEIYSKRGEYDAAKQTFTALADDPEHGPAALRSLANLALYAVELETVLEIADRLDVLSPGGAGPAMLRANVFIKQGNLQAAEAELDIAAGLGANDEGLHFQRMAIASKRREFSEIWRYWLARKEPPELLPHHLLPRLTRLEDARGMNVLVRSEQGFGDILQFARFIPALVGIAESVTFYTNGRLQRLLTPLHEAGVELCDRNPEDQYPDFICPMLDLPHLVGADTAEKLLPAPYLRVEPEVQSEWQARVGREGFRIGIVWQGNAQGAIDYGRSIPLDELARIAEIDGVRLIALQKGTGIEQIAALPQPEIIEVFDAFDAGEDAFIDTAALASCLDLIVTTDTSVAHVVGALGLPAVLLLKYDPDWRWTIPPLNKTVWYQNTVPLRQDKAGDWAGVVDKLMLLITERMA